MGTVHTRISTQTARTACSNCGLLRWCLPACLNLQEGERFDYFVEHQRPIKRDGYLHRAGSGLKSLYAIRNGFLKTSITDDEGREQICGFYMAGELTGMDAISSGKHLCDAVALEDCDVCGISFVALECLNREISSLQHHFHRMMSSEIAREHGIMFLLGSMRAEERLAMFLLNLSKRYAARGCSATHFKLPMTREEIASYLGLKLETVSRMLSQFQRDQLIAVQNRNIEIKSLDGLQQTIGDYQTRRPALDISIRNIGNSRKSG
jgi:CRP/FNR family transcriptional regulator